MRVVAIEGLSRPQTATGELLASLTGMSRYEAQARLRCLSDGPSVIASFGEPAEADQLGQELKRGGFIVRVLAIDEDEPRTTVISYDMQADRLFARSRDAAYEVPFSAVRLLLHGRRFTFDKDERTRPAFLNSPVTPLFGFPIPQPRDPPVRTASGTAPEFVRLYASQQPTFVLSADRLQFAHHGAALLPTRTANFQRMVASLRAACPDASYDDRLLTRGGQSRLLGPSLRPELHLEVAVALLASRPHSGSPYR